MTTFQNVYFEPWIGPQYGKFGVPGCNRLLVLGESHYCWESNPPARDETNKVVSLWMNGERKRFCTNTVMAVCGPTVPTHDAIRTFMNGVVFYNFVQEPLSGPRVEPTSKQWNESAAAFREVLQELSPVAILVLGKRLWSQLPAPDRSGQTLKTERDTQVTSIYETARGEAIAGYIHHPSSGFSSRRWNPMVQTLLAAAV